MARWRTGLSLGGPFCSPEISSRQTASTGASCQLQSPSGNTPAAAKARTAAVRRSRELTVAPPESASRCGTRTTDTGSPRSKADHRSSSAPSLERE